MADRGMAPGPEGMRGPADEEICEAVFGLAAD